jgi:hypothetical protein
VGVSARAPPTDPRCVRVCVRVHVCRNGTLGAWLAAAARAATLPQAPYQPWALLRRPEAASALAELVAPLATVPFTLSLYYEDPVGSGALATAEVDGDGDDEEEDEEEGEDDAGGAEGGEARTRGASSLRTALPSSVEASWRTMRARLRPDALAEQGQRVVRAVRRLAPTPLSDNAGSRVRVTAVVQRTQPGQPLGLDLVREPVARVPGLGTGVTGTVLVVRAVAPGSPAEAAGAIKVRLYSYRRGLGG